MKLKTLLPVIGLLVVLGCKKDETIPIPEPQDAQIALGRDLFFNETFNGNGRVCASCHPDVSSTTINPIFIATLDSLDPLFVAEFNNDLSSNFENPVLMRGLGLIVENLDGFDSLATKFTMRGIPHVLGMSTSIASAQGPRTGWSGDGAPGDGTLRSFATGAVIQHFTKTLNRIPDVDFRLPTAEELDALEAFQLSLGRQEELQLPLPLKNSSALRGQEIFNDPTTGKCFACHNNAGANGNPGVFGGDVGNLNFNTGVEDLPDQPADLTGELVPPDDGFGVPGDGTFNTPSVVEAADTPPFFHNNSVKTLEGAVAFYNGDTFNNSPAGQLIVGATGSGINIDATQVDAVAIFLRVINALDNIDESLELLESYVAREFLGNVPFDRLTLVAKKETADAALVLEAANLHPEAVVHLKKAISLISEAHQYKNIRTKFLEEAIVEIQAAKALLIQS